MSEQENAKSQSYETELTTLHTEAELLARVRPSDNFQPPSDIDPLEEEKEQRIPIWLHVLCFIAVLTMANQVKLPVMNGVIALADIGFIVAFIAVLLHLFIKRKTIHIPWMAPAAIGVFAIANILSQPGMDGGSPFAGRQ